MNRLNDHAIGDAFLLTCIYGVKGGSPIPISDAIVITSSVRTAAGLTNLDVIVNPDQVNNPGVFQLQTIDTQSWAAGLAQIDIKYVTNGLPKHTHTLQFQVYQGITP